MNICMILSKTWNKKTWKLISSYYDGIYGCLIDCTNSFFIRIAYSVTNFITGKGQEGGCLPLSAVPLMMKLLEKIVRRVGRGCLDETI